MKILVLEDEFSIRSFVTLNLKREGYDVIEAGSGEEAIELYDKNQDINIAVLDVMLPGGIDGFDVLKYIRTRSQNIGIIMLTARTNEEDKVLGLEYGADDYINKPFSPKQSSFISVIETFSISLELFVGSTSVVCLDLRLKLLVFALTFTV